MTTQNVTTTGSGRGDTKDVGEVLLYLVVPALTLFLGVVGLIWASILGLMHYPLMRTGVEVWGYSYFGGYLGLTDFLLLVVFFTMLSKGEELVGDTLELFATRVCVFISFLVTAWGGYVSLTSSQVSWGVSFVPLVNFLLVILLLAVISRAREGENQG
ncbi:MAG: hypothetical protein AAB443_03850 [Patescibacteria group bacterium]